MWAGPTRPIIVGYSSSIREDNGFTASVPAFTPPPIVVLVEAHRMCLVKGLQHLIIDHSEVPQEKGRNRLPLP